MVVGTWDMAKLLPQLANHERKLVLTIHFNTDTTGKIDWDKAAADLGDNEVQTSKNDYNNLIERLGKIHRSDLGAAVGKDDKPTKERFESEPKAESIPEGFAREQSISSVESDGRMSYFFSRAPGSKKRKML